MEEEKVVRIKLKKKLLQSERQELWNKRKVGFLVFVIVVCLVASGFLGGYLFSESRAKNYNSTIDYQKFEEIAYYLNNVWLYSNNYEDLNQTLEDQALYGMTAFGEDPYTTYMSADEVKSFYSGINMDFVGIGVSYTSNNDIFTITRVYKNSPAEKAGIMAGDLIKKIDGNDISGLTSDEIKAMVQGEEDTIVQVTVMRQGEEITFDVTRKEVDTTVYAYAKDDYVVMELSSFGKSTAKDIISYLDEYTDYSKLIIDLRNNTGGYQSALEDIVSLLLGNNKIALKVLNNKNELSISKTRNLGHVYDNFEHIVILMNQNTASASEAFIMAMKEQHSDVTLVGTNSYGKGVVQSSYYLEDGSVIKLTTSEWLSPEGNSINKEGIAPDVEVELADVLMTFDYSFGSDDEYTVDMVSNCIRSAQQSLDFLDYQLTRTDGYFDEGFRSVLMQFQKDSGLEADGILDYQTYETILSALVSRWTNDESKDPQMTTAIGILADK